MHTRSFDTDGRLKTHRVGSDTRTLTYDAASRITQTTDTNPVTNRTYDYDALDRFDQPIGQQRIQTVGI
ncbi:MAG: hypothetical protein IPH22_01275 [Nitrosomonas sp.]|nr:hypothetical protein [Nitrosomonas sp.]